MQALDYLLKRISNDMTTTLHGRNLKLVISFNNSLWYGDFVQMKGNHVAQSYIDDSGEPEISTFGTDGSNAVTLLKLIMDSYFTYAKNERNMFWVNPFKLMNDLPLIFETLQKILIFAQIPEENISPFHPYLLNAKSIDGTIELPFINLEGESVKLISIIDEKK